MLMSRLAVLMALAMLASGCSSYSAPKLTVREAEITSITDEALVINFAIDAENRNQVELPLVVMTYRLLLNGREVFRGVRSPEATLRRLGTQQIELPTVVQFDERVAELEPPYRYRLEGKLTYITPGSIAQILFDTGVRRPRARFRSSGTLELSEELNPGPIGVGDADVGLE